MILDLIWGCLSSHGVMTQTIRLLRLENTNPAWSWWKSILLTSHLQEWSRRKNSKQFHIPLNSQTLWRVQGFPMGSNTCFRCSAQHYPPFSQEKLKKIINTYCNGKILISFECLKTSSKYLIKFLYWYKSKLENIKQNDFYHKHWTINFKILNLIWYLLLFSFYRFN